MAENWLRAVRERTGLNIKQIAEILGAPYQTVVDWNSGRRSPADWLKPILVEKIEQTLLKRITDK